MQPLLPICYYPTTTVLLDDKQDFLEGLTFALAAEKGIYHAFTQAQEALEFIAQHTQQSLLPDALLYEIEGDGFQQRALNLNLYDVPLEMTNAQRFEQVSCVVVDYSMPQMNGLEVCKAITSPYIQKILLTGVAEESVVIEAFNQGLIQHYIRKSDKDLHHQVMEAIEKASWQYFRRLSETVWTMMFAQSQTCSVLLESAYPALLQQWMQEHQLIEYYIFETIGSMLMLDAQGVLYAAFFAPETELEDMAEEAALRLQIDRKIVEALQDKTHIFCYYALDPEARSFPDMAEWGPYLQPATLFEGAQQHYYVALTSEIQIPNLSRLHSFASRMSL